MSAIRAVVFDMDGTILNTEMLYPKVSAEILRRRGLNLTQDLTDAMMGRPAPVAFQAMIDWHDLADTIQILERESEEIFADILEVSLGLMPGFTELFKSLKDSRYPLAVCTSASRSTALDLLSRFNITPDLDFVIGGDEVQHGKPHPEIYLTAASRLAVSPQEIAVFEDSETGCRAAIDAGTHAIAVPGDHSRKHTFDGAQLIADTLHDQRIYDLLKLSRPV
ncbi:HAD family hydrolase [Bremerella cremea]|uniref:HAD family phosphatase n=1 Tax=Blastopirellula marina TaxID=124 RepID=A0A2S8FB90_9BACT|nr:MULTISPECIES: HAD-IA family hydrolase [Pirellulaceae]PQO29390.1 HAD family phosphatase [Blastopirellula marina]RCS42694.1 HAD family hydrolase [Bremerella cremea]